MAESKKPKGRRSTRQESAAASRAPARKPGVPTSTAVAQKLLDEAQAARNGGDRTSLQRLLMELLDLNQRTGVAIPRGLFYELGLLLFQSGEGRTAELRLRQGLKLLPGDFPLTNLLGVVLKNQGRLDESLACFDEAAKLDPESLSPPINSGNVHLLRKDGPKALACFARVAKDQPLNAEYQRLLGTSYRLCGRIDEALLQFTAARKLDPKQTRAWIESAALTEELGRGAEAIALIDEALACNPEGKTLAEAKLALLRRMGRQSEVISYAKELIGQYSREAWVHLQYARCVMHFDRPAANDALREAVRLEPRNPDALTELADSLDRTRGAEEGACIAEAYDLAKRRIALGGNMLPHARVLSSIMNRACDFDAASSIGTFEQLTNYWADTGFISALHYQMAQVRTDPQRRLLLDAHRRWGRSVDAMAARAPLARPAVRHGRAKLRVGWMSSDLRNHPVSYFALPLIEGYDRNRFEFYCYSWNSGKSDWVQSRIASLSDGWRLAPSISDRDAAQMIANDELDILIELGGTTYMNKLAVMAYKPARIQASWLGYPHSAGPESIDYLVVDPFNRPAADALLVEKPMVLPRSWVVLGDLGFNDRIAITPGTPESRAGHITFGTMNNPYKYNRDVIATWARVLNQVEDSHFLFVRPEGSTPGFRDNIRAQFAAHGIAPERIEFEAVRGTHMPHYNRIEIALDTFPQTGGTTTCEALWMGVPTITLVGPAFYERLSYSNLTNAGLPDLCATDIESYVQKSIDLATDRERRTELRATMRERIRSHPLGRTDWYVEDFQNTIQAVIG